MDGPHLNFIIRTIFFSFLLLISPQFSAQQSCSPPTIVEFVENNAVGDVVVQIGTQTGVTVSFQPPPANPDNPFSLKRVNGNTWNLIADTVLDRETSSTHQVQIFCKPFLATSVPYSILVNVTNVNDNPPFFEESLYQKDVKELSPVGTVVGFFPANDADGGALYYRLTPESAGCRLQSATNATILTTKSFDYDKSKNFELQLYVQDTPLGSSEKPSFNDFTIINVTIVDVDDRPPWFQPCTQYEFAGTVVCTSSGYTGRVFLNEQQTGALELKPGPVLAVHGGSGINERIIYAIVSGNEAGVFEISASTGNITMLKAVTELDQITLTVLAAQETNGHQFAATTVSLSVLVKSLHKPEFGSTEYEGIITEVGRMAENKNDEGKPLQIFATDADYAAAGGLNPHITYSISGSDDFSLVDGFLFMTSKLPHATYSLQVTAVDQSNNESATAQLSVDVKSAPTGEHGTGDMVALGVTLGALLCISTAVSVFLFFRNGSLGADCSKVTGTNTGQSSLGHGSGGTKGGTLFNNIFLKKNKEDNNTPNRTIVSSDEPHQNAGDDPIYESIIEP